MSIPQSGGGLIEHKKQLCEFITSGFKPKKSWRIGTEHEKFGWLTDSYQPLPYQGQRSIFTILNALQERYGWSGISEGEYIIGLERCGANISLEPGGQLELSGAPLSSVNDTEIELLNHLSELSNIASPMGVRFLSIGTAPQWEQSDMPKMPKGRYRLMTDYMDHVGTHGKQMMYRTATVQVNLDYASEADMVKKLRVAIALQPVATALFASSPFTDDKPNKHMSWRSRIWRGLDNARTGMLPFVFDEGFGVEQYVDWVLDVPMYFVYRNGAYHDALGQSFRDFLNGTLPALPGEKPLLSDWADHLTTVFPEARVKKFIEMRGADAGNLAHLLALPAFWVGLMYEQSTLDAAWDMVKGYTAQTRESLRISASEQGLNGSADNIKIIDLAKAALRLSQEGLIQRAMGEERFLAPLWQNINTQTTQASRFLTKYETEWNKSLIPLYDHASLF